MKKALLFVGIGALVIASGWYFLQREPAEEPEQQVAASQQPVTKKAEPVQPGASAGPENEVLFVCDDNKTITAVFTRDIVGITLSDGRQFELRESVSASGAKYEDTSRGLVFWGEGDTAFFEEKSVRTHSNCTVSS